MMAHCPREGTNCTYRSAYPDAYMGCRRICGPGSYPSVVKPPASNVAVVTSGASSGGGQSSAAAVLAGGGGSTGSGGVTTGGGGKLSPPAALQYFPMSPVTVLNQVIGTTITVTTSIRSAVPNAARAFSGYVTVWNSIGSGFLTIWPAQNTRPGTSNVNFQSGFSITSSLYCTVSPTGQFSAYPHVQAEVRIDVNGYFAPMDTGGLWFFP